MPNDHQPPEWSRSRYVRTVTMFTVDANLQNWPHFGPHRHGFRPRPCGYVPGQRRRLPKPNESKIIFVTAIMYTPEVFGVMPKEAKDCLNALLKVAEEDKLFVDIVLLVPQNPPRPTPPPRTFWQRMGGWFCRGYGGE